MYAHLDARTDEQRTNIKRGTALVCGYKLLIQTHYFLNHFNEHFGRYLGHYYASAGRLQASRILLGPKYAHFSVRTAISFQAFKGFLTIMQARSGHVQLQIFIRANLYFAPLAVLIIAAYIVVCRHVSE